VLLPALALYLSCAPPEAAADAPDGVPASHRAAIPREAALLPSALSPLDWQGIIAARERARHAVTVTGPHSWQAHNPGQQWRTAFDGRGFSVTPTGAGWTWGLELTTWGRTGKGTAVPAVATTRTHGNRVSYLWNTALEEWYVNDTRGLEHGYTLHTRPDGLGPIMLDLRVRGGLRPHLGSDGRDVVFSDASAAMVVRYAGLTVLDADHRELPARFAVEDGHLLRLTVDDAQARYPITIDPVAQQAYLKAANAGADDSFGASVAVAGDTVVVGAPYEDGSSATRYDDNAQNAGAAYVFARVNGTWNQQAYLKAAPVATGAGFGLSVAISGETIVIGAPAEAYGSYSRVGAAYVFGISNGAWTQQARLASPYLTFANFGQHVAVDGGTIVVGSGVSQLPVVFVRSGLSWIEQAQLSPTTGSAPGTAVGISGDTIVVGAPNEDCSGGAAYVFIRDRGTWTQQAYLRGFNTEGGSDSRTCNGDRFGSSVAISGNTLLVGAAEEDGSATGVNGTDDNDAPEAGAAYVFVRSNDAWSQQAYLKASNTGSDDRFGSAVAIDGDALVVGAPGEDSSTKSVDGDQTSDLAPNAGAAYIFTRSNDAWSQQAYLKASNADALDRFGGRVAIKGNTVVVGAQGEASNSSRSQTNNKAPSAGAAYVFTISTASTDGPDLVISAISAGSSSVARGSSLAVSDTTRNDGTSPAARTSTGYYLSTDDVFDSTDAKLGERRVAALEAGADSSASGNYTVQVVPGTYYLLACADIAVAVSEVDEANNCSVAGAALTVTESTSTKGRK
jgi:hypothetical protein